MLTTRITALVHAVFAVAALPHLSQTRSLSAIASKLGSEYDAEAPSNTTLAARDSGYLCSDLSLPDESTYRTGYEDFCNRYTPDDHLMRMGPNEPPLVATYMLKMYDGNTVPWIYKIDTEAWGAPVGWINRTVCMAGFREMLEGEYAQLGREYCVVENTGGDGDGKGFWGEGIVLKMEGSMSHIIGDHTRNARMEARKRKGEFDPENPN